MIGEILVSFLAGFVVGAAWVEFDEWRARTERRRKTRLLAEHPERLTDAEAMKIAGGLQR